ncbi:hypothetical protein BSLG_006763 [Batrachochytrium salamandrivorans]|nr:hypothetical protein BSLG_006763 [Batrachochytrium salamandrivorans]
MGDYDAVEKSIRAILSNEAWDDGSLGPVLLRLSWHASGTYDSKSRTGGSNGATMRFKPESTDGANAGLEHARQFLEPIKASYPWISYADLWTLAGVVALQAMHGPKVVWRPGRSDKNPATIQIADVPPNGRLPDAALGASHVRDVFYRMGFNDQEIVALSGAHALGRCHTDRSGYSGLKWEKKKWDGPEQFVDPDDELMMLPTDIALLHDPEFAKYVHLYAKNKEAFFKDFAQAYSKLLELGIPRTKI